MAVLKKYLVVFNDDGTIDTTVEVSPAELVKRPIEVLATSFANAEKQARGLLSLAGKR